MPKSLSCYSFVLRFPLGRRHWLKHRPRRTHASSQGSSTRPGTLLHDTPVMKNFSLPLHSILVFACQETVNKNELTAGAPASEFSQLLQEQVVSMSQLSWSWPYCFLQKINQFLCTVPASSLKDDVAFPNNWWDVTGPSPREHCILGQLSHSLLLREKSDISTTVVLQERA